MSAHVAMETPTFQDRTKRCGNWNQSKSGCKIILPQDPSLPLSAPPILVSHDTWDTRKCACFQEVVGNQSSPYKHKSDHISPLLYTSQGCLCFPLKIQTPSWCQLGPAWASLLTVTVHFPSDLCQGLQQAKGFPSLVSLLVLFPRCLATGYLSPPGIHHLRVTALTAI